MPRRKPGAGYAAATTVPAHQSRAEIERILARHKCNQYATAVDHITNRARVQFRAHDRIIRFEIGLPSSSQRNGEQLTRQRWRQLLLVIKAKLESVENQIASFEEEFLAHIVLPNDQTVGPSIAPLIADAYRTGRLPPALLALPAVGDTGQ